MALKNFILIPVFLSIPTFSFSQESFKDSISISISKADSIFLAQNLSLLAEKCNVDAARAQIIQAKLFKNINISVNQNVYNTEYLTNGGRKWFDFTDRGETSAEVQKLFLVAGKRNKQIRLAETGAEREEQLYFDLLRTLKYSLHSQFYNIYYLERIVNMYSNEISSLTRLSDAYEISAAKGYISKKEYLRIKALLFSLENERLGYVNQVITAQSDFNILLHTSNLYYLPVGIKPPPEKLSDSLRLQVLIDTAFIYRYDLKAARSDVRISDYNLSYQKALAVPDLTISGGWDRNGSYIHNYNYVGLQLDLPIFDRNQGNIKTARFNLESSKYRLQGAEEQVRADVISAYASLTETERLSSTFNETFLSELEKMKEEMFKNFEKRNISLIEFLDYYDAYKTNSIQLNTLLLNRENAYENLYYSIGKDILTN